MIDPEDEEPITLAEAFRRAAEAMREFAKALREKLNDPHERRWR